MCRSLLITLPLLGLVLSACQAAGVTYFVATNGNDRWSGKLAAPNGGRTDGPFATLPRARDAIRAVKAKGELPGPVTVRIRGGVYTIAETITFTPEDSGTRECPVTYAAYRGEKPLLRGGRRITGLKAAGGKVLSAILPEVAAGKWYFRSLFVSGPTGTDDERLIRARTPNYDPADPYHRGFFYVYRSGGGFGRAVSNIHNPGDWMEYAVDIPADGDYAFWMWYGADMRAYGVDDMGGHTTLTADGGEPVPLLNLPNTGGWEASKWSRCATVRLTAGKHTLRWQNVKGGGLDIGAFALSDDPGWTPVTTEMPKPAEGKHFVLIQAEDFVKFEGKQLSVSGTAGIATAFRYKPGDIKPEWARPDAEVHIFQTEQCRAYKEIVALDKVDPQKCTATVSGKECTAKLSVGDRYFVENVPDALDSPGEWYLNRQTGELRVWPKTPLTGKAEIIAPAVGRLIELVGDAKAGTTVSHLHFRGLGIWDTDYTPDDGCLAYGTGREGAVYLGNARACTVADCDFRNVGKYAVCAQDGGNNRIVGNEIACGAEGGIVLCDSGGNAVTDNHIHDCGWVYKHVGGVVLEGPKCSDNLVAHNLIHEIPRYGISLKGPGSRNVIEYNHIYNVSTETFDTGGIEVTQQDREFRSGSTIRYNIVHDVIGYSSDNGHEVRMCWAIYLDSFAGGYDVNHNITYRNSHGGLMLQGGKDNKVWNNVFANSTITQALFANFADNTRGNVFERNIVYFTEPNAALFWAENCHEGVMTADRNLYWHAGSDKPLAISGVPSFADWQKSGHDANALIADPRFVNAEKDDFTLKADSPAFKLGFEAIDTSQIGIRKAR